MAKIVVLGLGYIGLPTSIVLAESGHKVIGFDIDFKKVSAINACDSVIDEPEISPRLKAVIENNSFYAVNVIESAEYFIIAVPTPITEDKKSDLSFVWNAARSISKVLKKNDTVILESTVPVGTTLKLSNFLQDETGLKFGIDFFVAYCPERVLPGKIFYELVYNSRIVGGINFISSEKSKILYESFVRASIYLTQSNTAEMVKLVENSSRDVQIAFAHQVASMASSLNIDPYQVIELANKHPRVNILNPRCGVGGHCIAVDPWFLIESFPEQSELLKSARKVNDYKPFEILEIIKKNIFKNCKIALLGLTYKPDVDDLRESPALLIAKELKKISEQDKIEIFVIEPYISTDIIKSILGDCAVSLYNGLLKSDVIVCLVPHKQFKNITEMNWSDKTVLDFCGLFYKNSYNFIPEISNNKIIQK